MKRRWITALVALLLAAAALAVDVQLTVTRKIPLKGELEDRITFGLLKEMTCDAKGNIFSPSNRKYGDAINSIVRFPPEATSFTAFSIDSDDALDGGTITDFDLGPNGELFVLARQVLKYSDVEVPIEFGKTFLLHYDQAGKVVSRVVLRLNTGNFEPTGIATLQGGEVLVVGRHLEKDRTYLNAEILLSDGNLKTQYVLNPEGTKTSKGKTASGRRVFYPAAIKANGLVYVLRGTTTEPIYVLSQTGVLLKAIQLKPADFEFESPKILGNELIVSQPPTFIIGTSRTGVVPAERQRKDLTAFNLETGEIVGHYFLHNETAGLACATTHSFTFIGQDASTEGLGWAVFETVPAATSNTKPPETER